MSQPATIVSSLCITSPKDGDVYYYSGELVDNQPHGIGTATWLNGSTYLGSWQNGQFDGYGEYCEDNSTYVGSWKQGLNHGAGKVMEAGHNVLSGQWKNGLLHGPLKLCDSKQGYSRVHVQHNVLVIPGDKISEHLASSYFLHLLIGEPLYVNADLRYALAIMSGYLSRISVHNPEYLPIAQTLQQSHERLNLHTSHFFLPSAMNQLSFNIFHSLSKEPALLCLLRDRHAIGLQIGSARQTRVICKVYNSDPKFSPTFHPQKKGDGKSIKYQTTVSISVPQHCITPGRINQILQDKDPPHTLLANLPGAAILHPSPEEAVWQSPQKAYNCTLEWIFAYLKNSLSPEQYNKLRIQLFQDCVQQIDLRLEQWLGEREKSLLIQAREELKRKILKRQAPQSVCAGLNTL